MLLFVLTICCLKLDLLHYLIQFYSFSNILHIIRTLVKNNNKYFSTVYISNELLIIDINSFPLICNF